MKNERRMHHDFEIDYFVRRRGGGANLTYNDKKYDSLSSIIQNIQL